MTTASTPAPAPGVRRLFVHPVFLVVIFSHFIVDTLNSQIGMALAWLSPRLNLTNSDIGLIATLYSLVGALAQPVFGWLSDRYGSGWSVAGGVLWMGFFFLLAVFAPGWWAVGWMVVGALGSALFHPAGTMRATQVGRVTLAGQGATAASVFFLFGQAGLSLGPGLGGMALDAFGLHGLLAPVSLALLIGAAGVWALRPLMHAPRVAPASADGARTPPAVGAFVLVLAVSGLRIWAQSATTTFVPKFFHDQQVEASVYGWLVALFMGGTAWGGVWGGSWADRHSPRAMIAVTLALSSVPFAVFPLLSLGMAFPVALVMGLLNGASHSVLVTLAQNALPNRAGLASGLILGASFAVGALGVYLSGMLADAWGLPLALQTNAALSLIAAGLSLRLRR